MIDWLIDCLIDWLIDCLIDWLIDWLRCVVFKMSLLTLGTPEGLHLLTFSVKFYIKHIDLAVLNLERKINLPSWIYELCPSFQEKLHLDVDFPASNLLSHKQDSRRLQYHQIHFVQHKTLLQQTQWACNKQLTPCNSNVIGRTLAGVCHRGSLLVATRESMKHILSPWLLPSSWGERGRPARMQDVEWFWLKCGSTKIPVRKSRRNVGAWIKSQKPNGILLMMIMKMNPRHFKITEIMPLWFVRPLKGLRWEYNRSNNGFWNYS